MNNSISAESGTLQTEGGPLYYEVAGEGHPVLLIHAGIADHTMWDGQWEAFASRYRVVRYDTRAYGKSPVEKDHPFSNRQDIYELFRHLGIERAHVIGVSRGGQIATDFTLEHPEIVSALVPVCAGVGGMSEDHFKPTDAEVALFEQMEVAEESADWERVADLDVRLWVDGAGQPEGRADSAVREKVRQMCLHNYRTHTEYGAPIVLDPPAAGRLSEIQVPTLVIVGDLDVSATHVSADKLVSGIPGARKYVFKGVAHLPPMEKPEEFNRVVLGFLDGVRVGGKS
jgi:pimeloyl-ACP methyl ester carboxylesterase